MISGQTTHTTRKYFIDFSPLKTFALKIDLKTYKNLMELTSKKYQNISLAIFVFLLNALRKQPLV